jgi:serine/threonine-protein kinase
MENKPHPKQVGPYTVVGIIGSGGMGAVYRVVDPATEDVAALKLLRPSEPLVELLGMDRLREIFSAEAGKMASLHHPNIVRILDLELSGETPYFTMEYHCNNIGMMIGEHFIVEDTTRVISPDKVLVYGGQVLEGLRAIHAAGIIHRDIKPHNILVTQEDTARICDFGMARHDDDQSFHAEGLKIGSPYYIAPEQNRNPENADERSDLYSTGVMLYRMLTGELPGMKSLLLSRINALFDRTWDDFFIRTLEWNPAGRFQEAREMAAALRHLELHWERRRTQTCSNLAASADDSWSFPRHRLRTSPVRVSGIKARQTFGVDELWQPSHFTGNDFVRLEGGCILDRTTGLVWQESEQGEPLGRMEADRIIRSLNTARYCGLTGWRLPTVNELLTLVNDPAVPDGYCGPHVPETGRNWYWSCDRRSEKTSWYVNIRPGYTGWQENGCRYTVRAVATFSP